MRQWTGTRTRRFAPIKRRARSGGVIGGLVALVSLIGTAPAALAGTITITGDDYFPGKHGSKITYAAHAGEQNNLTLRSDAAGIGLPANVTDSLYATENNAANRLDSTPWCVNTATRAAKCQFNLWDEEVDRLWAILDLGNGNDVVNAASTSHLPNDVYFVDGKHLWLNGQDGNDRLTGGSWDYEQIDGGSGQDFIGGGPKADTLRGGSGYDIIDAQDGVTDTVIDCGADGGRVYRDSVDPAPVNCTATGATPSASITDGPGEGLGDVVNTTDATFTFSSEPGATLQCRLDGGSWGSCSSPKSYSGLTETPIGGAAHTFDVRATDFLGVTGSAVSYEWSIDTTPPKTRIDAPGGLIVTKDTTPALPTFGSDDPDADHYECSENGSTWFTCEPDGEWPGPALSDGAHTLHFRAVDGAGNHDPSPEEQDYLIDTVAPEVSFDNGQDPTGASEVRATFIETGSGAETGTIAARRRGSLDSWKALPTTVGQHTLRASLSSLAPDTYEFRATVTDEAGNTGQTTKAADGTDLVLKVSQIATKLEATLPGGGTARASATVNQATIPYRKGSTVAGTLTANGVAIANQRVTLVERFAEGSAQEKRIRTLTTNAKGEVSAPLDPGPSRTAQLVYGGAGRYGSSASGELALTVRGAVSLKAKKRVKAGRRLKFKGKVGTDGAVTPRGGKLVEVQVKVQRKWKAVTGAKRTKPNGKYRLRYRFGDFYTRPTKFKFRTEVLGEQGWPYMTPSFSKKRKVTVLPPR